MIYWFGRFALDANRRELRRGRDLIAIEPQVFDVLECFVRNRHRIVSKDDLLAEVWGGRIVSESTLSSRISAVRRALGDSGAGQRLLRTIPRKGYRFVGIVRVACEQRDQAFIAPTPVARSSAFSQPRSALAIPQFVDRASIAVLPFEDISTTPEPDRFADGLVEDITTALSQFRWLLVSARGSRSAYPVRGGDAGALGRELGVRYILRGTVRRAGSRVCIVAQLIDTASEVHLWASRFDEALGCGLDLQERITASVVGAIAQKLEDTEIVRARLKLPEELDAQAFTLRGMGSLYQWTRAGVGEALGLFRKAIQLDPEFAPAHAMAAYCYVQRRSYGWTADREREAAESAQLARRAAELAGDDAVSLSRAAHAIAAAGGDIDSGADFAERAVARNPYLAAAWYASGWIRMFLGNPEFAAEHLQRAARLSQFDQITVKIQAGIAYAHFFTGRYDEAAASAECALRARPNYLTALRAAAAGHALAGRLDRARALISQMRLHDPVLRISTLPNLLPFHRRQDFTKWVDALGAAGLPE